MSKRNFLFLSIKTSGYLLLPLVLLFLPPTFFDEGPTLCLSKLIFDRACLGCGMTRAVMHLIHLDVAGARYFNKFSFIVLPVLIWLWTQGFLKDLARWHRESRIREPSPVTGRK